MLLHKIYPRLKIGLIWNYATQHYSKAVMEYLKEMEEAGRLCMKYIPKGLTSVMQVCDLIGNKTLKQFICSEYYSWRANKISEA